MRLRLYLVEQEARAFLAIAASGEAAIAIVQATIRDFAPRVWSARPYTACDASDGSLYYRTK